MSYFSHFFVKLWLHIFWTILLPKGSYLIGQNKIRIISIVTIYTYSNIIHTYDGES